MGLFLFVIETALDPLGMEHKGLWHHFGWVLALFFYLVAHQRGPLRAKDTGIAVSKWAKMGKQTHFDSQCAFSVRPSGGTI